MLHAENKGDFHLPSGSVKKDHVQAFTAPIKRDLFYIEQLFSAVTPYLILLLTDDETLHPGCSSPKSSALLEKGNNPPKFGALGSPV